MNSVKKGILMIMCAAFGAQAQSTYYWNNTASGVQLWSGANWTNSAGEGVTPANGGDTSYVLAFTPSYNSTLTPSNDFSTLPFVLNGITARGGSLWNVLLKGGGLMLTNNGSITPAVNVMGSHSVNAKLYLDLPLTLAADTLFAVSNAALHVRAVIDGNGGLIVSNLQDGVATLYSNNTFSGGVNLQSGTLEIKAANSLGAGALTLWKGTTLANAPGAGGTVTNDIAVAGDATIFNSFSTGESYKGRLSGAAMLSVTNVGLDWGTNALANFNGVLDLNLNNLSYADGTPHASLRLSEAGLYSATNATLQLTRATLTNKVAASINLGALSGTVNGHIRLGTNTLTVGYLNQTNTFAGTILEAKLVKVGAGMMVLSGANTYTNTTTVNAGTLRVEGSHAGGGAYTVASAGTLIAAGDIAAAGLSVDGTLQIKVSEGSANKLTVTGAVALGAGSSLAIEEGVGLPEVGEELTIIDNDGDDAVSGQFTEGTLVTCGDNSYTINYAGGTGNDVTLTRLGPPKGTLLKVR